MYIEITLNFSTKIFLESMEIIFFCLKLFFGILQKFQIKTNANKVENLIKT